MRQYQLFKRSATVEKPFHYSFSLSRLPFCFLHNFINLSFVLSVPSELLALCQECLSAVDIAIFQWWTNRGVGNEIVFWSFRQTLFILILVRVKRMQNWFRMWFKFVMLVFYGYCSCFRDELRALRERFVRMRDYNTFWWQLFFPSSKCWDFFSLKIILHNCVKRWFLSLLSICVCFLALKQIFIQITFARVWFEGSKQKSNVTGKMFLRYFRMVWVWSLMNFHLMALLWFLFLLCFGVDNRFFIILRCGTAAVHTSHGKTIRETKILRNTNINLNMCSSNHCYIEIKYLAQYQIKFSASVQAFVRRHFQKNQLAFIRKSIANYTKLHNVANLLYF